MSVNNTNPSTLFGGTWEQIQGRFLLACDSTYANGSTGGSSSHTHTLSDNGFAYIGNYSERLNFASGSHKWSSYTGDQYSFTHNADAKLTSNDSHYSDGQYVRLGGSTDSNSSMPPYLAVYVWKRTK